MSELDDLPRDLEAYAAGAVVKLDEPAVRIAAHALAVYEGDGRAYGEDPDVREGFAERARLAVGIYKRAVTPP